MNIVFFGATELGYECCELLLSNGEAITGIFTMPREFNISYSPGKPVNNILFKDFNELGRKYNIPVITVNGKLKSYQDDLKLMNPDLLLVVGWYYMLPDAMISIAKKGAVAIHASLLPAYRGNAPLVWAIINGEKESGVSLFYLTGGVDEGDVIAQEKFSIDESDTIRDVLTKAKISSKKLLTENIIKLATNTARALPQDHSKATIFPKRSPEDGKIDWSWDVQKIKNFIRAQTKPYPGAFTIISNKKITIWDAEITDLQNE